MWCVAATTLTTPFVCVHVCVCCWAAVPRWKFWLWFTTIDYLIGIACVTVVVALLCSFCCWCCCCRARSKPASGAGVAKGNIGTHTGLMGSSSTHISSRSVTHAAGPHGQADDADDMVRGVECRTCATCLRWFAHNGKAARVLWGQWFGEDVQAVYTFPQDKQARRPRVVGGSNPFTFTHHTGEQGRTSCRS